MGIKGDAETDDDDGDEIWAGDEGKGGVWNWDGWDYISKSTEPKRLK